MMFLMRHGPHEAQLSAGRHMLTSTLAVEESVFETLRIKRYGRLMVLLTPAMTMTSICLATTILCHSLSY